MTSKFKHIRKAIETDEYSCRHKTNNGGIENMMLLPSSQIGNSQSVVLEPQGRGRRWVEILLGVQKFETIFIIIPKYDKHSLFY